MLNEMALRRPEWSDGYPVVLADGQTWTFPKPVMKFKPKIIDGRVEISGGANFGPESEGDLEILYGVVDVPSAEFLRIKFAMAVRLLLANYALEPGDVCDLLELRIDDPVSTERWEGISNAIMGVAPKPSPAI